MDLVTLALAKSYIDKKINEEGIVTGATPQQAQQIEQNKQDIADLQIEVDGLKESDDNGSGGEMFHGTIEEILTHTVTADEASVAAFTFTKAQYPNIGNHKTLLIKIKMPAQGKITSITVCAGKDEIIHADNSYNIFGIYCAATVHNGCWLQNWMKFTSDLLMDRLAPGYTFDAAGIGKRHSPYADYDSITIKSYQAFAVEGTTIEIYGGI